MPSCEENGLTNGSHAVQQIYIPPAVGQVYVNKKGIGELIMEYVKPHLQKIAQIDPVTGKQETYESMISRSIRVAQNLQARGIKQGDVISMCMYNNLDYTPVMLASFFIGTYTAPMDPTSPLCDFTHLLKLVQPKILFCDEESLNSMVQAVQDAGVNVDIVVFGNKQHDGCISFSEFLVEQGPENEFEVYKPSEMTETCCIHFSSGTTGLPKAVCVTHYGLDYVIQILKTDVPMFSKTVMIVTTPFWISNMNTLILAIHNGDTRVMPKKFHEKTCMKYVQDHKVSILFVTPTNGAKLLQDPENYNYDLSSLRMIASGGSPTSVNQFLNYIRVFPDVLITDGYGMTEVGGAMLKLVMKTEEDLRKTNKASCGKPFPGFRYKLVDPDTEETCGPNQPGELRVKSEALFKTYYKNHQAYLDSFDSDGFFRTGDIMYYEDDTYKFYYVTRIKDIFKYMGWHISPAFIEEQLMKHPNVQNSVVVGVPSKIDGEGDYPTAAVVLRSPDKFDEKEMINFVNDRLPEKYHIRGGIYPIESIPTTSTGKLQRRKISEQILKQRKNKL